MAIGWQSGSTGASKQSPSHLLEDAPLLDRDTTAGSGLEPHHRERPPRQRRLDERRRDELQRRHGAYDEISAGDQVAFLGQPEGNQWAFLWLSDGHLTEVGWQLVGRWRDRMPHLRVRGGQHDERPTSGLLRRTLDRSQREQQHAR